MKQLRKRRRRILKMVHNKMQNNPKWCSNKFPLKNSTTNCKNFLSLMNINLWQGDAGAGLPFRFIDATVIGVIDAVNVKINAGDR